MKYFCVLFTLFVSNILLFASCSASDDSEISQEEARYYVKYEVSFTTQHTNTVKNISFTTENGTEKMSFTEKKKLLSWEGTYGPVDKDFIASISCNVPSYSYSCEIHARIYVCREKEPFVIKDEGTGKYSLNLKYQIDF